ncbi:MAG: GerAB/ArcD/ProY family transporter [Patescibacteria group bacterium]
MNKQPSLLSPAVLFALLLVTLLGTDFLTSPHDAARFCGASGYWAPPAAFILAVPFILLLYFFQRRFPGDDLFAAARASLGKYAAAAGNGLFLLVFLAWLVAALRDGGELAIGYFFSRTPLWAVVAFVMLGAAYAAVNGLSAIGRLASFVLLPTVALRLGIKLLAFDGLETSHLLPLFSARPLDCLRGGLALAGSLGPLAGVLLFHPSLADRERFLPVTLSAAGGALFIALVGIVGTIGVFGAEFTQDFTWPNLASVQRVNLPYLAIEQVGLLFLIVWLTMWLVALAFIVQIAALGIAGRFRPALNRTAAAVIAVVALIGAILIPDAGLIHLALATVRRWAIVPLAGYILLVYFVSLVRRPVPKRIGGG